MPRLANHLVTIETLSGRIRRWERLGDYTARLDSEDFLSGTLPHTLWSVRPSVPALPGAIVDARGPRPIDTLIMTDIEFSERALALSASGASKAA